MAFFTVNLYENVIEKYSKASKELNIISGYGSARFLEKVLKDFPEQSIILYLGMTPQGISQKNHEGYIRIMKEYRERVKVYYQIVKPATHIKLYSWHYANGRKRSFAGSANFTENGFIQYHEMLSEVSESVCQLFVEQEKLSLLCSDDRITDFIEIYPEESLSCDENSGEIPNVKTESDKKVLHKIDNIVSYLENEDSNYQKKMLLKRYFIKNQFTVYDDSIFTIPVLNIGKSRWGVNAWQRGGIPFLQERKGRLISNFLDVDSQYTFVTDDGVELHGQINSRRPERLVFEENIYKYFSTRLEIEEGQPISIDDLKRYGRQYVHIKIIDKKDRIALFDFSA